MESEKMSVTANCTDMKWIFLKNKKRPGTWFLAEAWRYLFSFFHGNWQKLIATSVGSVIQAALIIPILLLIRHVLDVVIPQKLIIDLLWAGLAIVGIRILSTVLALYLRSINIRIMTTIVFRMRENLMQKIYTFSQAFYAREDQRLLQTRIVQDTERIANMNNSLVSGVIPSVLISLGLVAVLVILNWYLFLVILAVFPFIYFTNHYLANVTRKEVYSFQRSFEGFSKVTSFVMKFMELIKIQSMVEHESRKQTEILEDLRDKTTRMTYAFSVSGQVQTFLVGIAGIMVLVFGGISVIRGFMTLGDFFAFYIAANQLQNNINTLSSSYTTIVAGNESLITLHEIAVHKDTEPYHGKRKTEFTDRIDVASVSFQYDDKPVLQDINLAIIRGKSLAIIGPNGAGKSTLVNLLLGFYVPSSGTIKADGISYPDLDFPHFRKSIGVVLQHPPFIPGNIRENILYGNGERNSDEIETVAKLSLACDFIGKLPAGFDTQIGEDGVLLSGGERQMVAIARALMRKPGLLILDEPTNHLDNDAIARIMTNLKSIEYHPAILLISHNMDVVNHAEEIFMLDKGSLKPFST